MRSALTPSFLRPCLLPTLSLPSPVPLHMQAILNGEPIPNLGAGAETPAQPQPPQPLEQRRRNCGGAGGVSAAAGALPLPSVGQATAAAAGGAAEASPRSRKRVRLAEQAQHEQLAQRAAPPLAQQQQPQQLAPHQPQLSHPHPGGGLCWVGGPVDPPPTLAKTPYRRYYAAFTKARGMPQLLQACLACLCG